MPIYSDGPHTSSTPDPAGLAGAYDDAAPLVIEADMRDDTLSNQQKEQIRQLGLLDNCQMALARLFAGLPTFDTVLKKLLVETIKTRIGAQKLREPLAAIDPDSVYVNHFTTDSNGERSLASSRSFAEVLWDCQTTASAPAFAASNVGFFTRPDAVQETDSLFTTPLDRSMLSALESAFYIADPATSDRVRRQFREALAHFRSNPTRLPDATTAVTTQAALAQLLSRRFLHLFDLYKADRNLMPPASQSARIQQSDEDRMLDLITTHPSSALRGRLLRAPVALVYAVMLEMEEGAPKKWPAAMVIKQADRQPLFLYSLEGGLQRFSSFAQLVEAVRPAYEGSRRTIRDIDAELSGHVFEEAAHSLLALQEAALETVFNTAANETMALTTFAQGAEEALALPMLSLTGPLLVRQQTVTENNRPEFYKAATPARQIVYRRLEEDVFQAVQQLGSGIESLTQFTRQQIKQYLRQTVHADIDPDPDKTQVTLSFGDHSNPRQSRTVSLTQLMLDNLRPTQYPNAMREVQDMYLVDRHGQRIAHPGRGAPVSLTGVELASMASSLDVGGRYETFLRQKMNNTGYKTAWQAAYLANLAFKSHEAALKGDEVFKAIVLDETVNPPLPVKQLGSWLDAVVKSPAAQPRSLVAGRQVHVYGLVLGGSVGVAGQHGGIGNAVSVEGALIITDRQGPDIKGTVGVYLPDSPDGTDVYEFADLGDGIAALLQNAHWQAYFRSRISTLDPEQINRSLGLQGGRPLIRGALIKGDWLDTLHNAHVNFHSAYADHRSNSNLDVQHQTTIRLMTMAIEIVIDVAGMLLVPGIQLLKRAVRTGALVLRTGAVPMDFNSLAFVHTVARYGTRGATRAVVVPSRGQTSFLALTARQSQAEAVAGLPLEEALYRRFAVTDSAVVRGVSADAQGFYRVSAVHAVTGSMSRPVYVRQPDGTLFRVHDHTRVGATEATIVDPETGMNIRSSGVLRNTVARMPDGQWRAVGFGQGGGKRGAGQSAQPGPSQPKVPALSPVSDSIRRAGNWDDQLVDLVPAIMTRVAGWPQNRSLLIRDQITPDQGWSVRFTPGRNERIHPLLDHPDQSADDIVVNRTAQNHYSLMLGNRVIDIPADGDCFFNAVAQGLNQGQARQTFSVQGLRDAAADYFDHHPELRHYMLEPQASGLQRALFDNADPLGDLLGDVALGELTAIINGEPDPDRLFQPAMRYLHRRNNSLNREFLDQSQSDTFPAEMLQKIGRHLSHRPPGPVRRWYGPLSPADRQALRFFFEDVLLEPVESRYITEILEDRHLILSDDQLHIMLEYGVTPRELAWNYPLSEDAYTLYDAALHGHLDEDELEEMLDGVSLITVEELEEFSGRLRRATGEVVDDHADLLDRYIDDNRAYRTRDLYRSALERFPDLRRRSDVLLESRIISWTLGDRLRVSLFARWLRDRSLPNERLRLIAQYADTRYNELAMEAHLAVNWMIPFEDQNLQRILMQQQALTRFMEFLGGVWGNVDDVDVPAVVRLFRLQGQEISNSRVALILQVEGLWASLQRFPQSVAQQVWSELVGPYFTDTHIRLALEQPHAFRSALDFAAALRAALSEEEVRANTIVQNLFGIGQSRAQQYLYNFDFPVDRLGRSRLHFALHLEGHLAVPEWAWRYARPGVTRDSLKPFGELKAPPPPKG